MKIWLLRRNYTSSGGAERFTQRLAHLLHSKSHEVYIAAEQWPDSPEGHYQVKHIPSRNPGFFAHRCLELITPDPDNLVFSLERTFHQDIYRAGDGVHACWLARRSPYQSPLKNFWDRFDPKHRSYIQLEQKTFSTEGAGHIIANSAMVKREILSRFRFPENEISVIHSGVNLNHFHPCPDPGLKMNLRKKFGLPGEAVVWAFVGSGFERKGLRWAIEIAAAQKEEVFLLILGKGAVPIYQKLAESLDFQKRLVFAPLNTSSLEIYQASDSFILPTLYDPCSNATLEAAACGLPVITTQGNGAHEFVPSIALPNPSSYSEQMEQIQNLAKPLVISDSLDTVRSRLDEIPCWNQILEVISRQKAKKTG